VFWVSWCVLCVRVLEYLCVRVFVRVLACLFVSLCVGMMAAHLGVCVLCVCTLRWWYVGLCR